MIATPLTAEELAVVQRRVLRVLTSDRSSAASPWLGPSPSARSWCRRRSETRHPLGGIAIATFTVGTGLMAQVLSARMSRRGRRHGLWLGYGVAASGGLIAALGAELNMLPLFLLGLLVFSNGQAANLLARYAAADLALPHERSRAISRIVFASTFGAVFGPLLISPAQRAGEAVGLGPYTGPWLAGGLFFLLAGINIALRLRPDPLQLAGGVDASVGHDHRRDHAEHALVALGVGEDVAVPDPGAGRWRDQHRVALAGGDVDRVGPVGVVERDAVLGHHQLGNRAGASGAPAGPRCSSA
jgi:MFS family permease